MNDRSYESSDGGVQGKFYEFADDEYVQVETDDEGAVVLWSSDKPLADALESMSKFVGLPSQDVDGYLVTHSSDPVDLPSSDLVELALKDPSAVTYMVAAYGLASISWRGSQVKLKEGTTPHVECSIAGQHVNLKDLRHLIASTATQRVIEAVQEQAGPLVKALGDTAIS